MTSPNEAAPPATAQAPDGPAAPPAKTDAPPCEWAPLPVLQGDVERWNEKHLVVVTTRVPSAQWKVILEPIAGDESSAPEFRLLGQAPGTPAGGGEPRPETRTVVAVEVLGADVDQVVVHGVDDALVIPVH